MHRSDAAAAVRHALGDELGRAKVPELRLVAHGPLLRRRAVEARPVVLQASTSTSTKISPGLEFCEQFRTSCGAGPYVGLGVVSTSLSHVEPGASNARRSEGRQSASA